MYTIYKFLNNNHDVIYIGKAKNLKNRLSGHTHLSSECYEEIAYIMYTTFDTEHEMNFAERYYIHKLNPKYNTVFSNKPISFNCDDLDNKKFEVYEPNEYLSQLSQSYTDNYFYCQNEEILNLDMNILELLGCVTLIKSKICIEKCSSLIKPLNELISNLREYHPLIDFEKITLINRENFIENYDCEENVYYMNINFKSKYNNNDHIKIMKLMIKLK